ncbi:RDD family protein [Psychrobacillus vulpis]|uniref:RDD family protein n=1 Tax=Psychrobacillus vulpis TaxID=2325572 RepID=A0A544TST2_9BACI|nr:RDD family protein [Psychrobacillus vulpis]TQR20495.1 RDD family protein [Psychrobacillus vulpis]
MLNPVGFWARLGAGLLDGIIIGIPLSIICNIILGESSNSWLTTITDSIYSLVVPLLWTGYTVGKRIVGIRIVKIDGSNVNFWTMFKREIIGWILYSLTFGIGVIVSAFMVGLREDKRAIHDFIAGTYVTSDPPEY